MGFWSLVEEELSHHGDLEPKEERRRTEEVKEGVWLRNEGGQSDKRE